MTTNSKNTLQKFLNLADVQINGSRPWDIQIKNESVYEKFFSGGSVALGETYMQGLWDCQSLDALFYKILKAKLNKKVSFSLKEKMLILKARLFNLQTRKGSLRVAKQHYDLPSDFYMSFLDPYNQYTCGYFKNTTKLNQAQENKLNLICKKLYLNSHDKVLDIGCGWGGFAKFAAKKYGCSVTGITISKEQAKYAKKFTQGLPVKIEIKDYRDLKGSFDKILICGMIEHVGHKNYRTIMEIVRKILSDRGLFLLHTLGASDSKSTLDTWLSKYIFPNSCVPTLEKICESVDGLFVMEDWHNFGAYYDQTLMAWFANFDRNWHKFSNQYNPAFYRMFKYYFLMCAGSFRARKNNLWQIVFSRNGVPGGYQSFR